MAFPVLGEKAILFFYPKDNTPACTQEACSFNAEYSRLKQYGYRVFGISPDSQRKHANFIKKFDLKYTLISDTDARMNKEFGLWVKKKLYGHEYMGTARTTYILDEKGIITHIIHDVDTENAANQVIDLLKKID